MWQVHSCTSRLLDTESVASGLYRPEVDDPEYCGAGNTLLYELTALRVRDGRDCVRGTSHPFTADGAPGM